MMRHQQGFSLLEAIVALVILSMVAMALYGLQNANLFTMQRAEAHASSNEATRSALAVIDTINPMDTPKGDRTVGALEVAWQAEPVEPVKTGVSISGLPSLFDLGLFNVHVKVTEGPRTVTAFDVRQVGYKQVRSVEKDM